MEKISELVKTHPIASVLLGGAAAIAVLYLFGSSSSSSASAVSDQEGALQNAYFNAENIQAQTGAAVQIANIDANAGVAETQLNDTAATTQNTTWANADVTENASNNSTATSALPYAEESNLVDALAGVASQTSTTTSVSNKSSSGFLGIGASKSSGSTTITTSTPAAVDASDYLNELANGNFVGNG